MGEVIIGKEVKKSNKPIGWCLWFLCSQSAVVGGGGSITYRSQRDQWCIESSQGFSSSRMRGWGGGGWIGYRRQISSPESPQLSQSTWNVFCQTNLHGYKGKVCWVPGKYLSLICCIVIRGRWHLHRKWRSHFNYYHVFWLPTSGWCFTYTINSRWDEFQ